MSRLALIEKFASTMALAMRKSASMTLAVATAVAILKWLFTMPLAPRLFSFP